MVKSSNRALALQYSTTFGFGPRGDLSSLIISIILMPITCFSGMDGRIKADAAHVAGPLRSQESVDTQGGGNGSRGEVVFFQNEVLFSRAESRNRTGLAHPLRMWPRLGRGRRGQVMWAMMAPGAARWAGQAPFSSRSLRGVAPPPGKKRNESQERACAADRLQVLWGSSDVRQIARGTVRRRLSRCLGMRPSGDG